MRTLSPASSLFTRNTVTSKVPAASVAAGVQVRTPSLVSAVVPLIVAAPSLTTMDGA